MPKNNSVSVCANPACRAVLPSRSSLNRHYGQRPQCKRTLGLIRVKLQRQDDALQGPDTAEQPRQHADDLGLSAMDIEPTHDATPAPLRSVTVEDVEDEGDQAQSDPNFEDYRDAATAYGKADVPFQQLRKEQEDANESPWSPFESSEEWHFVDWMMRSGLSQGDINQLLELDFVSTTVLK